MTFVFEAQRLPFGEGAVPLSLDGISDADFVALPAWKRCLLPPVLGVVRPHFAEMDLEAWRVTMRIVDQLSDLEAAYSRAMEYRERQRKGSATAEERMMEELLRERMGDAFLRDSIGNAEGSTSSDDEEEVDIAMCFGLDGEVMAIGSAGLFGGHGYHP